MSPLILYAISPSNSAFPCCFYFIYYTDFPKHQAKLSITHDQLKCFIAGASFPTLQCIFSHFPFCHNVTSAIMLSLLKKRLLCPLG